MSRARPGASPPHHGRPDSATGPRLPLRRSLTHQNGRETQVRHQRQPVDPPRVVPPTCTRAPWRGASGAPVRPPAGRPCSRATARSDQRCRSTTTGSRSTDRPQPGAALVAYRHDGAIRPAVPSRTARRRSSLQRASHGRAAVPGRGRPVRCAPDLDLRPDPRRRRGSPRPSQGEPSAFPVVVGLAVPSPMPASRARTVASAPSVGSARWPGQTQLVRQRPEHLALQIVHQRREAPGALLGGAAPTRGTATAHHR